MTNVYFDDTPLSTGHSIRGIGTYTKVLKENLEKKSDLKFVSKVADCDLVHYPYFDLFFNTLNINKKKPTVVTIYDVISLLYPNHYPPGVKGKINFFCQKKALKSVGAVITISETSKKDIVGFLDVPAEKVFVTHLAARREFTQLKDGEWEKEIRTKYQLPEKFVLYVGDVNYNKNLMTLVGACKLINVPLVIIGKQAVSEDFDRKHIENNSLLHLIEECNKNNNVLRLGFVETEDLVKIYNLASTYCQPSIYEGFGLPILDAMACGVPVVASKIQVFVEIAERSALFVNPYSKKDMASGIDKMLADAKLSQYYIDAGFEEIKNYSWERTAQLTYEIYKKLI